MKKLVLISIVSFTMITLQSQGQASDTIKPEQLTTEGFKQKIYNYTNNPEEWVYEGKLPCIVDFYADWCKPCKMVAPILDELANEYQGKITFYKVNTDQQRELSSVFGIRSIPSVLFVPKSGKPQMTTGALPKETFKQVIDEFLLGKKKK
jgi:thioredoxin 1